MLAKIASTYIPFSTMSLRSVNHILRILEQQAQWQEQPFLRLLNCWVEVVGSVVAAHARPISIQRQVLWVATSSAAWSQNLTFGRQSLLLKLNQRLSEPLVDIRFSTAAWQRSLETGKQLPKALLSEHPSYLGEQNSPPLEDTPVIENANAAFEHWAKAMVARSHGLPLCPQCQCPTPVGELQRWQACSLCAVKYLKGTN